MRTKIDNDEGFFRLFVVLMIDALKIINLAIADTFTTTRLNNFHLGYFPIYLIYKPCKFVFFVLSGCFLSRLQHQYAEAATYTSISIKVAPVNHVS